MIAENLTLVGASSISPESPSSGSSTEVDYSIPGRGADDSLRERIDWLVACESFNEDAFREKFVDRVVPIFEGVAEQHDLRFAYQVVRQPDGEKHSYIFKIWIPRPKEEVVRIIESVWIDTMRFLNEAYSKRDSFPRDLEMLLCWKDSEGTLISLQRIDPNSNREEAREVGE